MTALALDESVNQVLAQLEPHRSSACRRYVCFWLVALPILGLAALVVCSVPDADRLMTIAVAGGAAAVILLPIRFWAKAAAKRLLNGFDSWRLDMIQAIDSNARYHRDRMIANEEFDASGICLQQYNGYTGSDFLAIGDGMRVSNLNVTYTYTETYYVTVTDSNGNSRQETRTRQVTVPVFTGLFMVLDAPLPHPGWVMVRGRGQSLPRGLEKVTLASPDFMKTFAVGASDGFIGHRVLSPSFAETVQAFQAQWGGSKVALSYRGNKLYVAIDGRNLGFGKTPGVLRRLRPAQMKETYECCAANIGFLKATATQLMPA